MATFVRTGSYNNCVIKVHGKQYFNGYENTEEELDNVPLKPPPLSTAITENHIERNNKGATMNNY